MASKIKGFIFMCLIKLINYKKKIKLDYQVKLNLKTTFEGYSKIYNNTDISHSSIGFGTYISYNCKLTRAEIGRFCSIGPNVNIVSGIHPTSLYVTTHPAFFSTKKQAGYTFVDKTRFKENNLINGKSIVIGNDVWIGQGVSIMEGVQIGDGAIIGANSLITKNVEPYSINLGSPAKLKQYRLEQKYISFLLNFKWWEKDLEWLNKNAEYFNDIEEFYNKYNQGEIGGQFITRKKN
jgi:acetyltransferase-like isoleucine patch superfamily enzyme